MELLTSWNGKRPAADIQSAAEREGKGGEKRRKRKESVFSFPKSAEKKKYS